MATKKQLDIKTVKKLGVTRLAEILMDTSTRDSQLKRQIKLETVGLKGPTDLAKAIRQRLATLKRARSYLDWDEAASLSRELHNHLMLVRVKVLPTDSDLGRELLWEFLKVSKQVLYRVNGNLDGVFEKAIDLLAEIEGIASANVTRLVSNVMECLSQNDYYQFDDLIAKMKPNLGTLGLQQLKIALQDQLQRLPSRDTLNYLGFSAERITVYLREVADAEEDADAYIALIDPSQRTKPSIAKKIADRLVKAKRYEEALEALKATADVDKQKSWYDTYITVLEQLGQHGASQEARWEYFRSAGSKSYLRDYLKQLDEVQAFDKEEEALDLVARDCSVRTALTFLVEWPDFRRAAQLVFDRCSEFDGYSYEYIARAAIILETHSPLASMLLLRVLIDYALDNKNVRRYKHAARHLDDCVRLDSKIAEYGDRETNESYCRRLQLTHRRKLAFWRHVTDKSLIVGSNESISSA